MGTNYVPNPITGALEPVITEGIQARSKPQDIIQNTPFKGVQNHIRGLERWRTSLGQVQKNTNGDGMGGVDIVAIGDSIVETNSPGKGVGNVYVSNGVPDYLQTKWPHYLKVKLQNALNPVGVVGGYGYIPFYTTANYTGAPSQGAAGRIFTYFGSAPTSITGAGIMGRGVEWALGDNGAFISLDPTSVPAGYRYATTDADFVYGVGGGVGTFRYDVKKNGTGGAAMIGTGEVTGTQNANNPTAGFGLRKRATGIDPTSAQTFQIAAPSASNILRGNGIILYNGDWDCGVRFHNLGYFGGLVVQASQSSKGGSDGTSVSNFDRFGSSTPGTKNGATHAKLYIFDWITNDVRGTTTVGNFIDRYSTQIDIALNLPSRPSVMVVIPPVFDSAASNPSQLQRYRDFRQGIYTMCSSRPDVVIVDFWTYVNEEPYSGFVTTNGWNVDGIHYSDVAQRTWANILFNILTS